MPLCHSEKWIGAIPAQKRDRKSSLGSNTREVSSSCPVRVASGLILPFDLDCVGGQQCSLGSPQARVCPSLPAGAVSRQRALRICALPFDVGAQLEVARKHCQK